MLPVSREEEDFRYRCLFSSCIYQKVMLGGLILRTAGSVRFSTHAFVVADNFGGRLSKSALQTVTAARKLQGAVTVGIFGKGEELERLGKEAASIDGVTSVVCVSGESYLVADSFAAEIAEVSKKIKATHIVGSTSSRCKDALPRVGALIDSQPVSEVIEVVSASVFKRPMYAGNMIATVESSEEVKILTVRPTAFEAAGVSTSAAVSIQTQEVEGHRESRAKFEGVESKNSSDKVDLASAKVVIAGGRGLKSKENFDSILSPLCDKLNGALGASRAAVDAGFAPNELQIGQTGKVVAPDLYIAVGISGATQHLAGMKDSRTIVAINKDKDAAIFQVADYGLVGDLFTLVPELTKKLG